MAANVEDKSTLNVSAFVRGFILNNADANYQKLTEAWEKAGHPKSQVPDVGRYYTLSSELRKKYGEKDLAKLPRLKGLANKSYLLSRLMSKNPNLTLAQCKAKMQADGLEIAESAYWKYRSQNKQSTPIDSPDPNQNKGPRAQVRRQIKRRIARSPLDRQLNRLSGQMERRDLKLGKVCHAMEDQLDDLMQTAIQLNNKDIMTGIRTVRRSVIIQGIRFTGTDD